MWTPLSSHSGQLEEHYGAVVIGSGYGGAITAARLAAAGHSVCVLERGKEWLPGQFPDELGEVAKQVRSERNPLGLYDYRAGHDLDVFSGSGLGGTSLINASVALRPRDEVFARARWPRAIREAAVRGDLGAFYDVVEQVLGVEPTGPYGQGERGPAKVDAHRRSAVRGTFSLLPLAVRHRAAPGERNAHGVHQPACTYCGDCITGCNVGAKGSLAMSYLPKARARGAALFTRIEVDYVLPAGDGGEGWFVFAREHRDDGGAPSRRAIHAGIVVVAAGALGSTGILLRSRDRGLSLGRRLGHHFSSNADQLGQGYNNDVRTDVIGFGRKADPAFRVGPLIMSMIDYRDTDGYVIQEGAVPLALVDVSRRTFLLDGEDTDGGVRDRATELARIVKDTLSASPNGALNHSMLYLGMGHDGADGRVVLDPEGRPAVIWGAVGHRPIFEKLSAEMRSLVTTLGGTYVANPRWSPLLGRNPVTVHPLGGCPMGDDADHGAVNDVGQVFTADGDLHPGLFVADGSVVPTSIGINPLLTISALSERIAQRLVAHLGAPTAGRSPSVSVPGAVRTVPTVVEPPIGLEFTERLRGHVTRRVTDARDEAGHRRAEKDDEASPLRFRIAIFIDDLARFIASADHEARCEGYVDGPLIGNRVLVERGTFNLFVPTGTKGEKRMVYRLELTSELDGRRYLLDGHKVIRDDEGDDSWQDSTTLFTSIREGWGVEGKIVAQGILHVGLQDFLRQLTTFRARNSPDVRASLGAIGRFGRFFYGRVWETYGLEAVL